MRPLVKIRKWWGDRACTCQSHGKSVEDGKTYAFPTFVRMQKFSDGSGFNADVALMNINRWAWDGLSAPLVEANKIDDYTIELVFENAAYPIIIELTLRKTIQNACKKVLWMKMETLKR
ncbi:MAG: hypothetical protein ACLTSZ_15950 [Lachnospiraceae bacterium]